MRFRLEIATADDAAELAALHTAVADDLTARFGKGHWSSAASERGVLRQRRTRIVYVARRRKRIIATLQLCTKKPWAIDTSYFTPCRKPLYLLNMAVDPTLQRQGIGRRCINEAARIARQWPAEVIRLDAYDAAAGAGGFYAKAGFRETGRVIYRSVPLIYYEMLL